MIVNPDAALAPPLRPAPAAVWRRSAQAWPWLALAALLGVAVLLRHVLAANTDVSWLITAGERLLGGQRLYVDVIETNPPMAVLAYLPGTAIARLLGITAETAVDALVFAGILAALALSARLLDRAALLTRGQGWPLALLAVGVLAVLPAQSFGQREHIALIAMLPMLATVTLRSAGCAPSPGAAVAAGLGAAVALAFKPHFALALLAALAVAVLAKRSLRVLFGLEVILAAAGTLLYAGVVVIAYPEFLGVIAPLVRDVYLPVHPPLAALLMKPSLWLWGVAMLLAVALGHARRDAPLRVMLAASTGFAVAYLLQRKGWPYHAYPMLALALLGCGYALITMAPRSAFDRALRIAGVIALAVLLARSMLWFDTAFNARPLQDRVAQLGLKHPAVLAITAEPGIGHPLVRALGGVWVSRQQALWVAAYLDVMRSQGPIAPALEQYAARERAMLLDDIRRTPPDVVLVDDLTGQASTWLAAHPDLGDVLRDFRRADGINDVGIWVRRN